MRVLAVDHGERRLGIAISDPTGTLARPLAVLRHQSRELDVQRVTTLVEEHEVDRVIVGESRDEAGELKAAGQRAKRFAEALSAAVRTPVEMWDESLSTHDARQALIAAGASRKRRAGHLDAQAAAVILQSYLDAHIEDAKKQAA